MKNLKNLKSLMLWKSDFKNERDWAATLKALDAPSDTTELELKCIVCVAKAKELGEWIPIKVPGEIFNRYECSRCSAYPTGNIRSRFCPNCGKEMKM